MGEESKIRDAADAVKGLMEAVPIYEDALQPAAKQIGMALETLAKAVRLALAPVTALVWGAEQLESYLVPALEARLRNVPPENVITPKLTVAGPALEALRFAGREESLRDLYANLLATAMDSETAHNAHPAFVEVLKQMTPDEAKLVQFMSAPKNTPRLVTVTIRANFKGKNDGTDLLRRFSLLAERAGAAHPELVTSYLDNLVRLGITEFKDDYWWLGDAADEEYAATLDHPRVKELVQAIEQWDERTLRVVKGVVQVTALGRQFMGACVVDRSAVVT
jgi:hypothetical protein